MKASNGKLHGIAMHQKRLLLYAAYALLFVLPVCLFGQTNISQLHQLRQSHSYNKTGTAPQKGNLALLAPFAVQQADSITNPLSQIIQSLAGPGVAISNIQTTLPATSNIYGSFTGGTNIIGIENGLVMTSGSIFNVMGPNISPSTSQDNGLPGYLVIDTAGFDAAVISFDVISTSTSLSFKYVFASEEYNEYVGSVFNDDFAFLISGPGIPAGTNIALVPGTNHVVDINDINLGLNPAFYINNDSAANADPLRFQSLEYDGLTQVLLTSAITVIPGATYTITLIIQDVSDAVYDSGVFLQGGSITSDSCRVSLFATKHDNSCDGTLLGSIDLTVTGAKGTPHYNWTNGAITEDISNLSAGTYNVVVTDSIGCIATLSAPVTINANSQIPQAGIISGPNKVCINQSGFVYSIDPVLNASGYEWTIPVGMKPVVGGLITPTSHITIQTDSTFISGVIKVHGVNACGSGNDSPTFTVSKAVKKPGTPSAINGHTGVAYGYCAGNTYVFTTTSSNAATFDWVTTAGTILNGQGTNTISLQLNNPQTGCFLSVTASNCGGVSAKRTMSIRSVLPAPTLNGPATVSKNNNPIQTFTVSSIGNPSSYTWSSNVPSVKFSDGGLPLNPLTTSATSVTVNFSAVPMGLRNIRVTANNNCGTGAIRTKIISVTNGIRVGDNTSTAGNLNDLIVFPNPVHDRINISFLTSDEGEYTISLKDVTGRLVYSEKVRVVEGTNAHICNLEPVAPGIYTLIIRQQEKFMTTRIIKE